MRLIGFYDPLTSDTTSTSIPDPINVTISYVLVRGCVTQCL